MMHGLNSLYIYCLLDPDEGLCRYVGITDSPIKRLQSHIHQAKNLKDCSAKCMWIRTLLDQNKKPFMMILDVVSKSDSDPYEVESKWIHHFSNISPLVTNKTGVRRVRRFNKNGDFKSSP